jgi:hypothetical protein
LTQGSFIFGLPNGEAALEIFPFDTTDEYESSLYRYTLQGVVERDSINGLTFDSSQAITGIQKG